MEIFTAAGFAVFLQVIAIDLVLAGDNAVVIGLAAAGLPKEQRTKAILVGILAATALRILFALAAAQLMAAVNSDRRCVIPSRCRCCAARRSAPRRKPNCATP